MITIKLTPLQEQKLAEAVRQTKHLQQQFYNAQSQLNSAANHQQSIMDMIYEAHNVDPKSVHPAAKFNLNNGILTINEADNSARIRKALSKNLKPNGHKATAK